MLAPTVFHVLLLSLLASLVPGAFSLPGLKQVTRAEVVTRQRARLSSPLMPRQSPAPCVPPTGTAPVEGEAGNGDIYDLYYTGAGETEAVTNPGNDNVDFPPVTGTIHNVPVPEAVQACLDFSAGKGYDSFDLSFLQSTCAYSCTAYIGVNMDAGQFDVANADVLLGYGYSQT